MKSSGLLLLSLFSTSGSAFIVVPRGAIISFIRSSNHAPINDPQLSVFPQKWMSEEDSILPGPFLAENSSMLLLLSDAMDVVKTVAIGAAGLVALLVGLAFLFSNFIIPKAAEELEKQARSQYPDLWREYAGRLAPGETLMSRPDIMQDLGNRVQQRMNEEFDAKQRELQSKTTANATQDDVRSSNAVVIDAEIENKDS